MEYRPRARSGTNPGLPIVSPAPGVAAAPRLGYGVSVMAKTLIYLADLAHCQTVPDTALPVPLSLGYVAAYARRALGDTAEIRLFKHPERLLAAVAELPPDVIGFANYGWNVDLTRTVGKYLRRQLPHALMVAGGPNLDPE
ncbi:MAG: cobalamin B12-binding domain-containing protein, partial [Alphaproteobacteria bacterium]|nr:cobalamin B12-binding domain-containing protein [Alphaproteobacteria bacterium]